MFLTVFLHNLSPNPLWYSSWSDTLHFILHTFLHPIIVLFPQHMPIPCATCAYSATCSTVVPRLYHLFLVSLSTWNLQLYIYNLNTTHPSDNSHLCLLKCHLIFFSYRPGNTSIQHTTLHTTAAQSPYNIIIVSTSGYLHCANG